MKYKIVFWKNGIRHSKDFNSSEVPYVLLKLAALFATKKIDSYYWFNS